ncbi:FAD-dependent oxidoreductase, partial [Rhizobium binae]
MTKSKFDAIVIGAGMSGNAAAYSMARRGLKVLQLERGEHSGSKNVQGAILYANMLEAIIPNFRDDAPLERHLVEQRFWLMDDSSHTGVHYRSDDFNELKPNRYTIIRAQFDKWFSSKVREAGGTVLCETTATKLARDRSGSVIGVYTDREGGVILADVVVLAEGVNGLLGTRAGLRDMPKPENVALAVKEMHFMPEEVIAERFGLTGGEGCVIEAGGTISRGMAGLGFLYTNKESISVGIGCLVSGLAESMENPYRLLDAFKQHPSIRPLLAGSEIKEYAAHLIPEGGFKAIPQLFGNGWVVVGDAAQLNNAVHREGSNLAMTSGLMAGEAIFQIKSRGGLMTKHNLSLYKGMLDKSFVMKDLMKHKDLPSLLHTDSHNFLMTYPTLISQAAQNFVRVDGAPKINREKATAASFINARSRWG